MAKRTRHIGTLDLFAHYVPEQAVERFDEAEVRAFNRRGKLAKAVSKSLQECGQSREAVAKSMSELLGEDVSRTMLDQYSSQANEGHTISALGLAALAVVVNRNRVLNALLNEFGLIAVPARFESLLRREMAKEAREKIEREEQAADLEWRRSRS